MKIFFAIIFFSFNFILSTSFADEKTHCKKNEADLFSCSIINSTKVVSLCGNRNKETKMMSWMQYRFGKIGHLEIVYPTIKTDSLNKFYGSEQRSSYYQYDIWFHIGKNDYSVSASLMGDEFNEETKEINIYIYYKTVSRFNNRPVVLQGTLMCSQPSEKLMGRLGEVLPYLQLKSEIEN